MTQPHCLKLEARSSALGFSFCFPGELWPDGVRREDLHPGWPRREWGRHGQSVHFRPGDGERGAAAAAAALYQLSRLRDHPAAHEQMTTALQLHPPPTQSLPLRQWPPSLGTDISPWCGEGQHKPLKMMCSSQPLSSLWFCFSWLGDAIGFAADLGERMKGCHCRPCHGRIQASLQPLELLNLTFT